MPKALKIIHPVYGENEVPYSDSVVAFWAEYNEQNARHSRSDKHMVTVIPSNGESLYPKEAQGAQSAFDKKIDQALINSSSQSIEQVAQENQALKAQVQSSEERLAKMEQLLLQLTKKNSGKKKTEDQSEALPETKAVDPVPTTAVDPVDNEFELDI